MSRIPEDEIHHLKREINLADLCRDYGIELKANRPRQPDGPVPVPRRPRAEFWRHALQESVELPGRLRGRGHDPACHEEGKRLASATRWRCFAGGSEQRRRRRC